MQVEIFKVQNANYNFDLVKFTSSMDQDKTFKVSQLPAQYRMRYYQNQYPEPQELVMAQVKNSEENGCYVYLLEYDMKEGMIPLNQYSKIMAKAIHRVMKVGKKQVLRVLRVDKEKGYIDLSKKSIYKEDQKTGEQKYANSAMVHSILIHISQKTKVPIKELYETVIWQLYHKKQIHPLLFLKSIMLHEERIDQLKIQNQEVRKQLLNQVKRRFKTSILKTMAEFSVQIKSYEGINAIKKILQGGVDAAKESDYDVRISIIGAPKYTCYVQTATKDSGKQALHLSLEAMKKIAAELRGDFKVDRQPKTVGDVNAHIQQLVEQQKLENLGNGSEQQDEDEA